MKKLIVLIALVLSVKAEKYVFENENDRKYDSGTESFAKAGREIEFNKCTHTYSN